MFDLNEVVINLFSMSIMYQSIYVVIAAFRIYIPLMYTLHSCNSERQSGINAQKILELAQI